MNLEDLCYAAVTLIKETGQFIRTESKTFARASVEYKGTNDMVSYVDKTSEQKLIAGLSRLLPGSGFIAEENTNSTKGEDFNWIIDPLDGTTNFVHGLPCYCISVALMYKQNIILGIIYEINQDECFYAYEKGGAFLNGNKITVSKINSLSQSLIATGFPYTDYSRLKSYMEVFNHCMYNTHGLRRLGSAAADLAYVACGRFETFYEYGLNAWDVAAGIILVKEAGGKVSDFSGGDNYLFRKEIIATNENVFDEFLGIVKEKFEE